MLTGEVEGRTGQAERVSSPTERARWRFVELVGLCGLAIAQPLLDVYSKNPLELISRQVEGLTIVAFVLVVVLVPPAAFLLAEQVVRLVSPSWAQRVHDVFLSALVGCLVLNLVPAGPRVGFATTVGSVAAAVGFWFALRGVESVRQWLRILAIAPVIFSVLFLASEPIAELAFTSPPAAATPTVEATPPSILMVVLDELPTSSLLDEDGAIDATRFPHIASLAGDGTWYRNHATIGSWTSIAVPAILTGRYPEVPDNRAHWSRYPENLFTLLGGTYEVRVQESSTRLCPAAVCPESVRPQTEALGDLVGSASELWRGLVDPFDEMEVGFEAAGEDVGRLEARDRAFDAVGELAAGDEPTLAYAHLSLPHQPWIFLDTGQMTDGPGIIGTRWSDQMSASSSYQRHLMQVEFADAVVGDLVEVLEEAGRYDDTLILLMSDHGASFRDGHDQRAISDDTVPDIAFPPLIVKLPGQSSGTIDDRPVQTIDILPTIADAIGVTIPWEVDGVSLLTDDPLDDRERLYFPVWIDEIAPGADGHSVLPRTPLLDLLRASGAPVGSASALDALDSRYRLGGVPLDDLDVDEPVDARVVVHGGTDLLDFDPDAPNLPLFVDLELAQDEQADLAIVVNDVVAVTGRAGGSDGRHLWAVIPPGRVQAGRNEIEVHRVTGPSDAPTLTPLAVELD